MRRLLALLPLLLFLSARPAYAQLANAQGWCESGATVVISSGLQSTNQVQGSFPSCTISVSIHGGGAATIYSTGSMTPLSNPFTAQTNGRWLFYAANGEYDITMTGGGLTSPVTYSDVWITNVTSGGGGGGTPCVTTANSFQYNNAGAFGCAQGVTTPDGNQVVIKGNSPWSDIVAFNAIATNGPFRSTATYTSGNAQITVSNAGIFPKNGVGITVQGAGASVTMSTPSAPTVTPQYASGPQRDHLMVNSPTGSSTYVYCIVAEDKGQGLTPCSSSTTITNGLSALGEQSATITSESLSNGTLTVNTSSGTFENAMLVDVVSGVPRFSGMMKTNTGTTNSFTVTKYVNDDRVTPQFISDVPNSTSLTGTVNYYQANTIAWTVVTGARRYWICAQRPSDGSLHVIGQSDMSNSSTGWQGNKFEDWGATFLAGQSFPFYITDAICTGTGQADSLTTTVASGGGTTTPTLTVAPSQTNNSGTMIATLDSGPALVAAANQAANGQGCIYIPPQSNILNTFRIESFTALASNVCIIQGATLVLDDTLELNNANWQTWNQIGTAQFGTQGGATVTEQTANPAIHLLGSGSTIRGISFGSGSNAATMITIDNSATKLSSNNCYLPNANDTMGICVQYRGINGGTATAIIDGGSSYASGLPQTQDASWVPLIDDGPAQNGSGLISGANGYELHIQDLYDSRRTISYSGGGFLSLFHHYIQGPIDPVVMFNTSAGGGVIPIYLNDVIGDTTGVPMVANISNVPNLVIRFDGVISSSITNPIVSGTRPLSISFGAWAPASIGSAGNLDNDGCISVTVITAAYEGGGSPPSGVAHPTCKTQSLSVQGGGYPLIAAPLPAPATPTLTGPTAGGSIPVSTYLYAVSATGFDGGDTMPSPVPSSSITTSSGNQTVTVNWVAVVGAKSYNIWRCDTAASGGCFTNINGNLPFIGPNWKEVAFHQTGTSFIDTVASPTNSTFAAQTATGLSQMDANEAIAPQHVSPETTAPTCVALFDQLFAIASGHRLSFCNKGGSVDQVVGAATTDTFTNKTFTSPINSPEVGSATGIPGSDQFWANSVAHRWEMINNNGTPDVVVGANTTETLANKTINAATYIGAGSGSGAILLTGQRDGLVPVNATTTTPCTFGTSGSGCFDKAYVTGYAFNQHATAGQAITYNLPTAATGKQYCAANSNNGSAANTGIITVATSASGQFIIFTDGTLTASGGNVTSGGAAADAACFVGIDSTHWQQFTQSGTWTKH